MTNPAAFVFNEWNIEIILDFYNWPKTQNDISLEFWSFNKRDMTCDMRWGVWMNGISSKIYLGIILGLDQLVVELFIFSELFSVVNTWEDTTLWLSFKTFSKTIFSFAFLSTFWMKIFRNLQLMEKDWLNKMQEFDLYLTLCASNAKNVK